MVECEFKPEAISDSESPSFNRYMVECEFYSLLKAFEPPQSFNRYMVECEWGSIAISKSYSEF